MRAAILFSILATIPTPAIAELVGIPVEGRDAEGIFEGLRAMGATEDALGGYFVEKLYCEEISLNFLDPSYHCMMRDGNRSGQILQAIGYPARLLYNALNALPYGGPAIDGPLPREWYEAYAWGCEKKGGIVCNYYNGDQRVPSPPMPTYPVPDQVK